MSIVNRVRDLPGLGVVLVCLPFLLFLALVTRNAVNLPLLDDYDAVLSFTNSFAGMQGWPAKLGLIVTSQHNEYKLIFQHLIYAAEFEATGHLNFIFLQQLGNLFIPLTAVCLWFLFPKGNVTRAERIWLFLPVSLLVFAPSYWETLDWAMSGLQNIAIVPFSLATILLLTRNRFALACFALALSISTSGNGFFLALVGLAFLLQQRRFARSLVWASLTLACAAVYAVQYHRLHARVSLSLVHSVVNLVLLPFVFLGGILAYTIPALALGLLLAVLFARLVQRGWRQIDPAAFYTALFLLVTALGVDLTRHNFGFSFGLQSRYRLYSLVFVVLIYYGFVQGLLRLRSVTRPQAFAAATAVCALFSLTFYIKADRVLHLRKQLLLEHAERWLGDRSVSVVPDEDPNLHTPAMNEFLKRADSVLRTSIGQRIFVPPYPAATGRNDSPPAR